MTDAEITNAIAISVSREIKADSFAENSTNELACFALILSSPKCEDL